MARLLTPSDFGIFASIILLIYLLVSLLNAMIIQPLQVTLAGVKDKASYISFTFWVQAVLVLSTGLVLGFILKLNLSIFTLYNELGLEIIMLSAGFLIHDYLRKLFLAKAAIKQALVIDLLTSITQLSALAAMFLMSSFSLVLIIFLLGIGYLPGVIFGIIFIKPDFKGSAKWKLYFLSHWHQSKWLLMTALVQWWSGNLFVVASGLFLGLEALGAFRLVQSLFGVLNILLQTFENYALPEASRLMLYASDEAKIYLRQISLKSAGFLGAMLLGIFLFSKFIIVLAGGVQYTEYAYVVKGMAILYLFIFMGYPIRMAIRALVLNQHFFIGYVFSFLFSLISFHFLLSRWSLIGAIIGLICSQIIVLIYWQIILVKNNFSLWK
jgi:O-antigen/teichoic acid export membrane protein